MVRARRPAANRKPRQIGIKARIRRELVQKKKELNRQFRDQKSRIASINRDLRSLTNRRR